MKFLATSFILTTIAAPLVVPARPAPQPGPSAAQAWFGTFTRRTGSPTEVVGDLTITATADKPHVEIFIMNERIGCEGGVAGSLAIDGTHAQLSPPLWTVDEEGKALSPATEACELKFERRPDSSIVITEVFSENRCSYYHGAFCYFDGDYSLSPGTCVSNSRRTLTSLMSI